MSRQVFSKTRGPFQHILWRVFTEDCYAKLYLQTIRMDCSWIGDLLCLFLWYMGDIYSFMHKSTSYQCFCMTDQALPPRTLSHNTLVPCPTIHKLSIHYNHNMGFALETYWPGDHMYLSRLCLILSTSLLFFLLFTLLWLSSGWMPLNLTHLSNITV